MRITDNWRFDMPTCGICDAKLVNLDNRIWGEGSSVQEAKFDCGATFESCLGFGEDTPWSYEGGCKNAFTEIEKLR